MKGAMERGLHRGNRMCENQSHKGATIYRFLQEPMLRGKGCNVINNRRSDAYKTNASCWPHRGSCCLGEVRILQSKESVSDCECL